jgi:hypothetical protein
MALKYEAPSGYISPSAVPDVWACPDCLIPHISLYFLLEFCYLFLVRPSGRLKFRINI